MKEALLAGRYARALAESVPDPQALEQAGAAVAALRDLRTGDPVFRAALENPAVGLAERAALLDAVLNALGAPPEAVRLLQRMLARNRMALLPWTAAALAALVDDRLNRAGAEVAAAAPLSPASERALAESLSRRTGRRVTLRTRVDAGLLGGFTVHLLGTLYDYSARTRLERLKAKLLSEETPHGN